MGCCNGDCLGSVQLVQGPAGVAGEAGAPASNVELHFTGSTDVLAVTTDGSGTPTVDLSDLHDYDVVDADVISAYSDENFYLNSVVVNKTILANTVGRNAAGSADRPGDILRLRFVMMGTPNRQTETAEKYFFKVELGNYTIVDTGDSPGSGFALGENDKTAPSAAEFTLDFIVNSVGNVDSILRAKYGNAEYNDNAIIASNIVTAGSLPPTEFKLFVNQPAAFDTDQALKLSIKNTTGDSSKKVKVVYYEIIKLHKG
jgi:hypothetical protein